MAAVPDTTATPEDSDSVMRCVTGVPALEAELGAECDEIPWDGAPTLQAICECPQSPNPNPSSDKPEKVACAWMARMRQRHARDARKDGTLAACALSSLLQELPPPITALEWLRELVLTPPLEERLVNYVSEATSWLADRLLRGDTHLSVQLPWRRQEGASSPPAVQGASRPPADWMCSAYATLVHTLSVIFAAGDEPPAASQALMSRVAGGLHARALLTAMALTPALAPRALGGGSQGDRVLRSVRCRWEVCWRAWLSRRWEAQRKFEASDAVCKGHGWSTTPLLPRPCHPSPPQTWLPLSSPDLASTHQGNV